MVEGKGREEGERGGNTERTKYSNGLIWEGRNYEKARES